MDDEELYEDQLRRDSPKKFCLYNLYKIFHYISLACNEIITRMGGDFVFDNQSNI